MKRFLRGSAVVCLLVLGIAYGLLYFLEPNLVAPWTNTQPRWHAMGHATVHGVAAVVEGAHEQVAYPPEVGKVVAHRGFGPGTLHFVVELPPGATLPPPGSDPLAPGTRAYAIPPNGNASPIEWQGEKFKDNLAILMIPPTYPPESKFLDIRIDVPGESSSMLRLTRLPQTENALRSAKPAEQVSVAGARLEGVAFRPTVPEGKMPCVGAALRANSVPAGQTLELRDLRMQTPFQVAGAKQNDPGGLSYVDLEAGKTIGTQNALVFADQIDQVRLSGKIGPYQKIEEELDFGDVPIHAAANQGLKDEHKYRLSIDQPITRTTRSGFKLSLMPEPNPPSFNRMTANWDFVCLIFHAESLNAGFKGSGDARLMVGPDTVSEVCLTSLNPGDVPGQHMYTVAIPKGAKTLHLKMKVVRKQYGALEPFELILPVRKGTAHLSPTSASVENMFFSRWPDIEGAKQPSQP